MTLKIFCDEKLRSEGHHLRAIRESVGCCIEAVSCSVHRACTDEVPKQAPSLIDTKQKRAYARAFNEQTKPRSVQLAHALAYCIGPLAHLAI